MKKKSILSMVPVTMVMACTLAIGTSRAADAVQTSKATLSKGQRACPVISRPPDSLHLDPFYKKYMDVNGIAVCSSWRVPDSCFQAAFVTLDALTRMLPKKVLQSMVDRHARVTIMARYEGTTDVPEHAFLANDTAMNWDLRARGLGGDLELPLTSCAEENILAYQIDKYHAEDILVHEFAHTIHGVGIAPVEPGFNDELKAALKAARAEGKYQNVYANTDHLEYFAEGVQDWFNCNAEVNKEFGDGKHNMINTREELKRYDPRLYKIISRYFPDTDVQVSRHAKTNLYNWKPGKKK